MSLVCKIATGKVDGSLTYVLSDATVDRYGDVIEPDGWQLDHFRKNPIALFNHRSDSVIGTWRDIRVEAGAGTNRGERLVADFVPAPPGTTRLADDVRRLIEANILRATSVGFRGIESEPINPKDPFFGGQRYTSQELLETSIVSVPANPAAMQIAKSMHISDDTLDLVFGGQADMRRREMVLPGGQAEPKPRVRGKPMQIAQQIQEAQTRLNAARDALTEYLGTEQQDPTQRDAMSADVVAIEAELRSLETAERALAPRGPQLPASPPQLPMPAVHKERRPLWMPAGELGPWDYFARAGQMAMCAYVQHRSIDDVLREVYPDDEKTHMITRAAQAGASTTLTTWAAELVQTQISDTVLQTRDPNVIFTGLAAAGTALNFGPQAGVIRITSEAATPSIGGSFVGEAQPIPVRRMGFAMIELRPTKIGVITRYSREIEMYSSPALVPEVRNKIERTTRIVRDTLLIDNVAGSATRPAGLLNGVTPLTATAGGGYAAIIGDMTKLTSAFYSVNAGNRLALLINPAQRNQLAWTPGPGNMGIGWTGVITNDLQVIDSTVVPAGTVIMVEAEDFVSVLGVPEFSVSEEATLHIEDTTPSNISTTGTPNVVAAPVESMFQTNQIALRMIWPTTWAMRRTGMVQYIAGVNWA